MTNEKSFAEIQTMNPADRRDYYAQRAKETNSQPMKKVRGPTRKSEKRKSRRIANKNIRKKVYDRPFDDNPQFQPKVAVAVQLRQKKMLRRLGYRAPTPSQ